MMHLLGGKVEKAPVREYGKIEVTVDPTTKLFENVSEKMEAITCADQTLYKAKQTRKGTCCIYMDEEGETGCYPF